jgi:hypothetical protein
LVPFITRYPLVAPTTVICNETVPWGIEYDVCPDAVIVVVCVVVGEIAPAGTAVTNSNATAAAENTANVALRPINRRRVPIITTPL